MNRSKKFLSGDGILFDNRNTFFGKAIGLFLESKFTHAGVIKSHTKSHLIIAEAVSNGFVLKKYKVSKIDKRIKKGTILRRRPVVKLKGINDIISKRLGIKYGYWQLLKIAWKIITKYEIKADKEKTLICSEGVSLTWFDGSVQEIDLSDEFSVPHDYITPKHILESTLLETIAR